MTAITLREITRDNWLDALDLQVRPDQQNFVAEYEPIVLIMLAKAYVRHREMEWTPLAIYADEQIVGLVALACRPQTTDTYWLYHFFIDHTQQGKGYGRQALKAFLRLVHERYPQCEQLSLYVNRNNTHAQTLYTRAGFAPTGQVLEDELIYQADVRAALNRN